MLHNEFDTITPRKLVMSLFNAPETTTLGIGQIIKAGSLFEFEPAAIRMTVTRLIKDDLIAPAERGVYKAGAKAIDLNSQVISWRTADTRTKQWCGQWLVALNGHLGRTNKPQLRSMIRAFQLTGFTEIEVGVWIRPANLVLKIDQLRHNLINVGMDPRTYLMMADQLSDEHQTVWSTSWPTDDLERNYRKMIATLKASTRSLKNMTNRSAARESLIIGESAIRLINLDPLLPKQIIDTTLFKQVVSSMNAYDKTGQTYWQKFLS